MQLRPEEISKIIKDQIKHYDNRIVQSDVGTVLLVGEISGMAVDIAGRMVEREINADDHRQLVDEFIKKAGEAS